MTRRPKIFVSALAAAAASAFLAGPHTGSIANADDPVGVPAVSKLLGGAFELHFTPEKKNGALAQALVSFIKSAKQTVDVAVFDIDHPAVVDALVERHLTNTVKVRVVMDTENDNPVVAPLKKYGLVRYDERKPFMHTKLIVVDGERVFAGSANATVAALEKEDNNAFFLSSRDLGARVRDFVNQTHGENHFGPGRRTQAPVTTKVGDATVELLFTPEDAALQRVVEIVRRAKTSIRFLAFNLSHPDIVKALTDAKGRKVSVEGVVDGSLWLSGNGPTNLQKGGVKVMLDGNPSLMHDKVFIVDRQTVVTGSFNFSQKAVEKNDEDLFVIKSKPVAAAYLKAYSYVSSLGKPLPKRPAALTPGLTGGLTNPGE